MKKVIVILAVIVSMSIALGMTSFAGDWQSNSKGWWYLTDDYTYPVSQWKNIDGDWYFFNAKGYALVGWHVIECKWYFLNDGSNPDFKYCAMLKNTKSPDGYDLNEDGAWVQDGIVMTQSGQEGVDVAKGISGEHSGERADLLLRLNEYRKSKGLPEVVASDELMSAAQERAKECTELFSHTRPNGQPFYTAENISEHYVGMSEIFTMDNSASEYTKMKSLQNSPEHNKLMLQREDFIENVPASTIYAGIGYYESNGYYYAVMIFGHKK